MKRLTPCKLKEIVKEEIQNLNEIGWDNLPDGWDEDSVESFARSLTDKTKDDSEGFFRACMDEVEDKFDDPEAFCASLKDEYLGTTDWRGKDESTKRNQTNMKLTESRLRSIIQEELSRLTEVGRIGDDANQIRQELHRYFVDNGAIHIGDDMYAHEDLFFYLHLMTGRALRISVFETKDSSKSLASAQIQNGMVQMTDSGMPDRASDEVKYQGPKMLVNALVQRADSPPMDYGRMR